MTGLLIAFGVCLFFVAELYLRHQNPYRLWKDAFDEASVQDPDLSKGWKPKSNTKFQFYHFYLKGTRNIRHNALGLRSSKEYTPKKGKDVFRLLLFGETTLLGWELEENQSVYALLKKGLAGKIPNKKVEVVPVAARNYSLGQLFTWYRDVFQDFEYDLLIYFFNENNPRRTITFHESGKSPLFTQPVYSYFPEKGLTLIPPIELRHLNDMIFLNEKNEVIVKRGTTRKGLHPWLREHLHLYCSLCDLLQGSTRLRKFKDRKEIKDIEKWKSNKSSKEGGLPFQWEICRRIFLEWSKLIREKGFKMIIIPNLQYYHAGNNWLLTGTKHPWGFNYDEIPSRKYLARIAEEAQIGFYDTYKYVYEKKINTLSFYINPRYAYYSPDGAAFQAEFIANSILKNVVKN